MCVRYIDSRAMVFVGAKTRDAIQQVHQMLPVISSSPPRYRPTSSRMILLIVVSCSAAFFLRAVCVSLDTLIIMFLSFLIATSVYSLLYTTIQDFLGLVKPSRKG